MVRGGLTEKVETDKVVRLRFENVGKLPPPVLQFSGVAFGYSPDKILYRWVNGRVWLIWDVRSLWHSPDSQHGLQVVHKLKWSVRGVATNTSMLARHGRPA